ncbi:MAG: TMEM165/GDT1 family protein [Ectothiorhodospiraceae bacterium]|nr:TMEM165/GDT1 family protein [Ectothiorhodospiraceae bacterium]
MSLLVLEQALGPGISSGVLAFLMIFLAEMGDKSQLVCLTLACRYRPMPVFAGAFTAFALLSLLAVIFGAALATWLPGWLLAAIVTLLFIGFGIRALRSGVEEDADCEDAPRAASASVFLSTVLILFVAEFGDKTQLATAGLSATASPLAVWVGATLGITAAAGLAIFAGNALLRRVPLTVVHRASGMLFIAMGVFTGVAALLQVGG